MSMSTLGQQLAAINAGPGKKNVGSTLATSRRHDDAIGRGLAHSVQVGHSVHKTLFKPSIIYEDARKASDVPLATILENCVASLRRLEELDPEFGVYVKSLCKPSLQERGLLTADENDAIDKNIEDLIFRLSLRMNITKSSNGTLSECLHVVEYLLRKFDVHLRPKTASAALLAMLPHHEQPFYLRLLQLMDLANMPEWTFLRPFAVPGARLSRSIIAQQACKDVAFLRYMGRLSQRNAKLPCCEKSLSFTAAVLVEALTLQTQRKGTIEERTCQALLPFVVAACRNHTGKKSSDSLHVWQHWGYIMTSTMVETSVLEAEPRQVLVNSILEGLVQQKKKVTHAMTNNHGAVSSSSISKMQQEFGQLLSNGLTVALTVLLQDLDTSVSMDVDRDAATSKTDCRLEVWSAVTGTPTHFGFEMTKDMLSNLLALDDFDVGEQPSPNSSIVADCLGQLYAKEGIVETKHWIASILVLGWKVICKIGMRSKKEQHCRRILSLLLSLVEHQPLIAKLWKESDDQWVESYTCFLVSSIPGPILTKHAEDPDEQSFFTSHIRKLLQSMRNFGVLSFEKGMTRALLQVEDKTSRKSLIEWLRYGKFYPDEQAESKTAEEFLGKSSSWDKALPPRIALEHPDPEIRLQAVPALVQEAKVDSSVCHALLQCIVAEESAAVAIAAAVALKDLLVSTNTMDGVELCNGAIIAYHKWCSARNILENEKVKLFECLCLFASEASKDLKSEASNSVLVPLMEILGVLTAFSEEEVSLAAKTAILSLWNEGSKSRTKLNSGRRPLDILISKKDILRAFGRSFESQHNPSELSTRRKLVQVILDAFGDYPKELLESIVVEAVEYCTWVYETFSTHLNESEAASCAKALLALSEFVTLDSEWMRNVIMRLCAGEKAIFKVMASPFVEAVCNSVGRKSGAEPLAILMELALSNDNSEQTRNIVSIAYNIAPKHPIGCLYSFVPMLALTVTATEEEIRDLLFDMVGVYEGVISSNSINEEWILLSEVGKYFRHNRKAFVSIGPTFLAQAFASVLCNSENADLLRFYILKLTLCFAVSGTPASPLESTGFENSWLSIGEAIGGCRVARVVLEATEIAGEECFPLLSRWRLLGKPLLDAYLESKDCTTSQPLIEVMLLTVRMIKGVKVVGKPTDGSTLRNTIISSGPTARGGRSRSYSFGKNENIAYLHPYPSDMQKVIVGILRAAEKSETLLELKSILCEHVLNSSTWKEEIFCHLSNNSREQIALSLIHAASQTDIRNAEGILFSLPLKAVDLDKLLASNISNANGLSQATLASDYIRSNASRLVSDGGFDLLIGRISGMLSAMRKNGNNDSHTFVRHALLDALLELLTVLSDSESDRTDLESSMNFDSWMDILVDEALDTDVTSLRTAKIAVSCLAVLCKISPKLILPKISRIISGVATDLVLRDPHQISVRLNLSVPVFLQYSSHSELIIPAMFRAFIDASKKFQESSRLELYRVFVGALSLVPSDSSTRCSPIGLFVVALLGGELFDKSRDATQVDGFPGWMRQLLSDISPKERLLAASTMQSFSRDTLHVGLKQDESQRHHDLPALNEFSDFDGCETGLEQICAFCEILSMTTYDVLSSTDLSSLVNASTNQHTGRLLLLWQECLLMQMVCQKPQVGALLAVTSDILGQTMNTVQKCLPPHVYLVFVTNLMKEGGTEIRSRAVQTIAERSQSLPPESPEATLFLEMIPVLLETINSCDQSDLETKLLRHSVFLAIDCIGRKFCGSDNKGKSYVRSFASVLSIAAESMWDEFESKKYNSFSDFPSDSRQLVSSAAICASTAAKICGQKAIPALPKLVPSLLEILSLSCDHGLSPSQKEEIKERADWNQARLVQLSILRALRTVITALPTMLKQYLVKLLNVVLLVPMRFQNDSINDHSALQNEQQKVVDAISSSIPLRQLIPAASLAISTITDGKSLVSLLAISAQSVKQAKTAEVSSQTSLILKMAFHAFEQKTPTERDYVWGATNDLVLCLVMKQSEVQFRRLYQKLLDWRSEGSRNYAFWQLSSFLSKQLKSIFLPCLTMVFSDVTEHLDAAASRLSKDEKKASADGKKRQRLSMEDDMDQIQLASLQPLLECLEVSLYADAQSGGAWIRDTEIQRYEALLQPLGKLLRCRLPCDGSSCSYQTLVQGTVSGTETAGSVVGCIVALASAAGDEQLWKPLNHVVLQACSSSRKEIRKAGILCLHSLVKSVGEEYMVLIPECLPTLAELLEDSDEEIAQLARDCIAYSEELLGESLQDSLL